MMVGGGSSQAASSPAAAGAGAAAGRVAALVVSLFFAWGFATVLIDTLIPKLKGLFQLNYAEAMLTSSLSSSAIWCFRSRPR